MLALKRTPVKKRPLQSSNPRAPLAVAAFALGAGIWLAGHVNASTTLWIISAAALILSAVIAAAVNKLRSGLVFAVLAVVCVGACARVLAPVPIVVTPPQQFLYDHKVEIIGHITDDGSLLAGYAPRERFDLQTESIRLDDRTFTEPVGVRATLSVLTDENGDPKPFPKLVYGQRVRFAATLRLPRNFRNPGAFDYEGYLHDLGISTLASVHAEDVEILQGVTGTRLGFWRSTIRRSILDHVYDGRLWNTEDAALFAAMIVGDDSLLLRHVREEFQATGVYHLLVVSGMNVGLLALIVFWLARRLRAPEWAASVITITLSLFYAFVAGMGVPILRAVLMLSLYLIARLFYRDRAALNAAGFAAVIVLVLSPAAWFEPSFQLTFLALLAISGISIPLLDRTSQPFRQALLHLDSTTFDLSLAPRWAQFRLDLRLIIGRLARVFGKLASTWLVLGVLRTALLLYELLLVSSVTQAVLVLPMRIYFHRAALIGLPANLLVLPLAGILMNAAVIAIALSYVYLPLARLAALVAATALRWTLFCIVSLSHWKVSQWRIANPTLTIGLFAAAGVVLALWGARRKRLVAYAAIAALFASAAFAGLYRPPAAVAAGRLEVTAIDVGQGDSLLVVSPDGRAMLIDGGGQPGRGIGEFDYGEDVVSPYLWTRGLDHLDVVVLTHAHADHISGLPRIIENFRPHQLWLGMNPETPALRHLQRVAIQNHVELQQKLQGDTCDWGGTQITVLSPPRDWELQSRPVNNDSLTFLISYRNTTALLAGDAEADLERYMAVQVSHADLLKVAHHGSSTSTTPELLNAARPRFAVISVGDHNRFGHPGLDVLERLQQAGARIYRTDTMGASTFLLDGHDVEPRAPGFP